MLSSFCFRLVSVSYNIIFFVQLEASTHQGVEQQIPSFNLPPKILCKVVYVQLRVSFVMYPLGKPLLIDYTASRDCHIWDDPLLMI